MTDVTALDLSKTLPVHTSLMRNLGRVSVTRSTEKFLAFCDFESWGFQYSKFLSLIGLN